MIDGIKNTYKLVKHILSIDKNTRNNDFLLIMKALDRQGNAHYIERTRYGNGWFISEKNIYNGKISPSTAETIRRTRQKIQNDEGKYQPRDSILQGRMQSAQQMRFNIHNVKGDIT